MSHLSIASSAARPAWSAAGNVASVQSYIRLVLVSGCARADAALGPHLCVAVDAGLAEDRRSRRPRSALAFAAAFADPSVDAGLAGGPIDAWLAPAGKLVVIGTQVWKARPWRALLFPSARSARIEVMGVLMDTLGFA